MFFLGNQFWTDQFLVCVYNNYCQAEITGLWPMRIFGPRPSSGVASVNERGREMVRLALTRRRPHPIPSAATACALRRRTSGGGGLRRVDGEVEEGRRARARSESLAANGHHRRESVQEDAGLWRRRWWRRPRIGGSQLEDRSCGRRRIARCFWCRRLRRCGCSMLDASPLLHHAADVLPASSTAAPRPPPPHRFHATGTLMSPSPR